MITIEKEILKTTTQSYRIGQISLINTRDRGWIAEIMFEILNDENTVIGTVIVSRTNLDYNTFWNDFNSGKYLFQLLVEQEKLNIDLLETLENEFLNC